MMLTKLLHDISQKGFKVHFDGDFSGMLTITFLTEYQQDPDNYIRHEHIGYPDATMDELNVALNLCLESFYNEVKDGQNPKRDGLSTKKENN